MDPRFPPREEVLFDELLARRARERPDKVFVVFDDGEEWTYARTAQEAWETANALRALGVREGDHVSLWIPGGKLGVRMLFGVIAAGAVFSPLNVAYRGSLLEHALHITGSWLLIAHPELLPRLEGLEVPALKTIVAVGPGADQLGTINGVAVNGTDALRGDATKPVLDAPRQPWDPMCLMFTSGTTGPSKGVHQSALFYEAFCESSIVAGADDRYYGNAPVFHNGWPLILGGMLRRGGSVFITDMFSASTFWDHARDHGVTAAYLIGSMATTLLKNPPRDDDATQPIRSLILAPNVKDVEEFATRFGVHPRSGYGSTEIGFAMRTEPGERDASTSGKPNPGYELRIVDEFDREVDVGDVGELVLRHDRPWTVCSGYKAMPEATARLWRNGWLHTGDAFRKDGDGKYYFIDRLKDVIRRRGENISSAEIEFEVMKYPQVQQCAAFGVEDEESEEEVMVVVRLSEGPIEFVPDELIRFLIERLPHFMVPRFLDVVDEMPLTATARVQKATLRERGKTLTTWDREAAGIVVKRQRLSTA